MTKQIIENTKKRKITPEDVGIDYQPRIMGALKKLRAEKPAGDTGPDCVFRALVELLALPGPRGWFAWRYDGLSRDINIMAEEGVIRLEYEEPLNPYIWLT